MNEKKKLQMEVGKKYRGYAFLNEYGEIQFTPERKGANEGKRRLVKEGDGFVFAVTDRLAILHVTIKREDKIEMLRKFTSIVTQLFLDLKDYDL